MQPNTKKRNDTLTPKEEVSNRRDGYRANTFTVPAVEPNYRKPNRRHNGSEGSSNMGRGSNH